MFSQVLNIWVSYWISWLTLNDVLGRTLNVIIVACLYYGNYYPRSNIPATTDDNLLSHLSATHYKYLHSHIHSHILHSTHYGVALFWITISLIIFSPWLAPLEMCKNLGSFEYQMTFYLFSCSWKATILIIVICNCCTSFRIP